jgi:hypothetical protein
MFYVSA